MKVYVVVLETEECTQVLGVYKRKQTAANLVKKDFDKTVEICEYTNLVEGETMDPPSNNGATIYLDPNDYWIWSICECDFK